MQVCRGVLLASLPLPVEVRYSTMSTFSSMVIVFWTRSMPSKRPDSYNNKLAGCVMCQVGKICILSTVSQAVQYCSGLRQSNFKPREI